MILLLAGTAEARVLAGLLQAEGLPALASFAGATAAPGGLGLPTRTGGFGGEAGFLATLREAGITAVIDATHPFAARIGPRTRRLCAGAGVPYLRLLRPGWSPGPGDDWRVIDSPEEAMDHIPPGATIWLSVGPRALPSFAALAPHRLLVRRIDPTPEPFPFPNGRWIIGRPSPDPSAEAALMQAHGVTHLVTKDSGGAGGAGKLAAARALSLPVILLRRPPAGPHVRAPAEALAWALREARPQGSDEP
ncbi:precorrin-6A/cobalt-precorrin-6A reductase [Pseudoroseicyclus tamaricis]|uniref:Cobalt-precorrin-6A reductase n=1 Tax=Pseudoroseicyclus tamaricis TaxID=2705421 RepID=A0A6B2JHL9_9RHOB|nr:precorrin-6A/cobalt-precorrin-6A reductase [Pseudoroseicyclus tamaricis]NDV00801.1 cobalt-precorrin-6A reductase [Pseudoroseicyclus tamaricis]